MLKSKLTETLVGERDASILGCFTATTPIRTPQRRLNRATTAIVPSSNAPSMHGAVSQRMRPMFDVSSDVRCVVSSLHQRFALHVYAAVTREP
jgi:hypothetical protein